MGGVKNKIVPTVDNPWKCAHQAALTWLGIWTHRRTKTHFYKISRDIAKLIASYINNNKPELGYYCRWGGNTYEIRVKTMEAPFYEGVKFRRFIRGLCLGYFYYSCPACTVCLRMCTPFKLLGKRARCPKHGSWMGICGICGMYGMENLDENYGVCMSCKTKHSQEDVKRKHPCGYDRFNIHSTKKQKTK